MCELEFETRNLNSFLHSLFFIRFKHLLDFRIAFFRCKLLIKYTSADIGALF